MLRGFFGEVTFQGRAPIAVDSPSFSVKGSPRTSRRTFANALANFVWVQDRNAASCPLQAWGIGSLSNRPALEAALHQLGQSIGGEADDFEVLARLYAVVGSDALRMADGHFCAVLIQDNHLILASGKTPGPKLYYKSEAACRVVFASEIKAFPTADRVLKAFSDTAEERLCADSSLTYFEEIYAVSPGEYVLFDLSQGGAKQTFTYYQAQRPLRFIDVADTNTYRSIRDALWQAVESIPGKTAICLVSGGLDSSIIGKLAKRRFDTVRYYSVGTRDRNEFEHARRFTDSIKEPCHEILFEEGRFLENLADVISLLEHPYSRYLEYIIPVHIAHKLIPSDADVILSGYGSDVLFAGFAKNHHTPRDISALIQSEYRSTYWANEASQTIGFVHDQYVAYPFFDSGFVDVAMAVSPHLCHYSGIEKYALRKAYEDEIAHPVVWRKKVGIHEGTGCEDFFSQYLTDGVTISNEGLRLRKDRFSYEVMRAVLVDGLTSSDIDFNQIRKAVI